jgi:hypothetical protein
VRRTISGGRFIIPILTGNSYPGATVARPDSEPTAPRADVDSRSRRTRTPAIPHGQFIWWIHPAGLTLAFILPLYIFTVFAVPTLWPQLLILRARDYLSPELKMLGAVTIVVLGGSAWLGGRLELDHRVPEAGIIREGILLAVGLVVVLAYCVWFGPILAHGAMLAREDLNRIPGITSFTQLGVPFSLAYVYATLRNGQRFSKGLRVLFGTVLVLTLFRVFAWMERLALIELAVPLGTLMLTFGRPRQPLLQWVHSLVRRLGPVLGLGFLWLFFAATEVLRSWTSYSQRSNITLSEFVTSRIATYYYTALNNGAGLLATTRWPTYDLLHVLDWAYKLPVLGAALQRALGLRASPSLTFLERFGDIEFNNMSGIFPIFFDLGIPLGLLYFGAVGLIAGALYRALLRGSAAGALLFPSFLVAVLEVMRVTYVNGSRTFLIFVGGILLLSQFRKANPGHRAFGAVGLAASPRLALARRAAYSAEQRR